MAALVLRAAVTVAASLVAAWALWTFLDTVFTAHAPRGPDRPARGGRRGAGPGPDAARHRAAPRARPRARRHRGRHGARHPGGRRGRYRAAARGLRGDRACALVREPGAGARLVSGIFFMADDAFRVGEYIDTGRLKGTVEKITLRSVQLRHQNGPFHTVPFGQLGRSRTTRATGRRSSSRSASTATPTSRRRARSSSASVRS